MIILTVYPPFHDLTLSYKKELNRYRFSPFYKLKYYDKIASCIRLRLQIVCFVAISKKGNRTNMRLPFFLYFLPVNDIFQGMSGYIMVNIRHLLCAV